MCYIGFGYVGWSSFASIAKAGRAFNEVSPNHAFVRENPREALKRSRLSGDGSAARCLPYSSTSLGKFSL